ncbi:putative peroxisomal lipase [Wickerhamomyces ciferrii]|uniref:Peroxisomal lipase n=1 Tax=Wickerhamomyces ciferrii (strain ATCC 14091 / BCRC 22168 / CBS 111 / JCM 3599 / NBRC 0793 / NRRL Y-1031 F-60-10) TaxID=1206466 RepID=K0KPL9_WICCF|nr:putative peroxisomal lipase [Wickerhamomyces ciferrii]CCH43319.1 putative peroxisomal lipase [Wickerhamomyces ciferrii]
MSLEQYKELAKQEQHEVPKSFIPKIIYSFKLLSQFLLYSKNTELEKALIQDEETFTSDITNTYSFIDDVENVGKLFGIKVPHPLSTQLNNSSLSNEIITNLESKINETPVLVFIHGLGGNFQQFDEIIKEFAGITDIFAIDLPGSGRSQDINSNFKLTLDNFVEVVHKQLESNGYIGRDIVLIGHSYGTQVILKLNTVIPNVKSLILLAPPKIPLIRTKKEKFFLGLFARLPILFEFFRKLDRLNNIKSISMGRLFHNEDTSDFLKFKQFRFNLLTNSSNFIKHAKNWIPLSVSDALESSQIIEQNHGKILIIDASDDKLTKRGGSTYYDLIGSGVSTYEVLENSGHNFILESYKSLNLILAKFLSNLNPNLSKNHIDDVRSQIANEQ